MVNNVLYLGGTFTNYSTTAGATALNIAKYSSNIQLIYGSANNTLITTLNNESNSFNDNSFAELRTFKNGSNTYVIVSGKNKNFVNP
jgi:hypothetical protein